MTDVYDRHGYADEDKRIMAAVARHVLSIVERNKTSNVVAAASRPYIAIAHRVLHQRASYSKDRRWAKRRFPNGCGGLA